MALTDIKLRVLTDATAQTKGSVLTWAELDTNIKELIAGIQGAGQLPNYTSSTDIVLQRNFANGFTLFGLGDEVFALEVIDNNNNRSQLTLQNTNNRAVAATILLDNSNTGNGQGGVQLSYLTADIYEWWLKGKTRFAVDTANPYFGSTVLVNGSSVVSITGVNNNTLVFCTIKTASVNVGHIEAFSSAGQITINSSNALDTSEVNYMCIIQNI